MATKRTQKEAEIKTTLSKHLTIFKRIKKQLAVDTEHRIMTLIPAMRIANKLLISEFHTRTMDICVCSNGIEYTDGVRELKIGDDVFIGTKKPNYITFAHYRMISLDAENNCELVYSRRIYDYNDIGVPKAAYKAFIRAFKYRHNI